MAIMVFCVLMSGCADVVPYQMSTEPELVGFWHGLWHGMILPFAWLCSLFSDSISIYAVYNNGDWYDFGFILGCGALSSSASSSCNSNKRGR